MDIDIKKMKNITGLLVILLFVVGATTQAKASSVLVIHETNPTSDTVVEVKNNVVLFKLISTPVASNANTNSGSLKKAGKVARTSYSHCTSIENIIYKKKGI